MSDASTPLPTLDAFGDLVAALLDGCVSEADAKQIEQAVVMSDEHLRVYRERVEVDAILIWWRRWLPVDVQETMAIEPAAGRPAHRRWWWTAGAIAAVLMLAIGVGAAVMLTQRAAPQPGRGAVSAPVAILSDVSSTARWASTDSTPTVGQSLTAGRLDLVSGRAQVMFSSGAVVEMIGPCRFDLDGSNQARLVDGEVSAYVPERARGFTIEATDFSVMDLGTRFAMQVDRGGASSVVVREGHVAVRSGVRVMMLGGSQAVRIDGGRMRRVDERSLAWAIGDEWHLIAGVSAVQGQVAMLNAPPKSVAVGRCTRATAAVLFCERRDVAVGNAFRVGATEPGAYHGDHYPGHLMANGARVDSYLLHFDPGGTQKADAATVNGSITFDRPIRGLITGTGLAPSDARFGSPQTKYDQFPHRGLEDTDELTLSTDRRTLHFHFEAYATDQVRILVDADPAAPTQPGDTQGD